jgi:predicted aspartyl protease
LRLGPVVFALSMALKCLAAGAPAVLPMESVNGHLVVALEDRSLGKLRLVVDTGAEKTLLSATVAAKAKVDRHFTDPFYTFNGFGQGKKARLKGHTKLELVAGERPLAKLDALVLDAGNLDLGVTPAPDGVLGWDFFQHLCVRLDSKGQQMTVGPVEGCATSEEGFYTPPVDWLPEGLLLPVTVTLANGHVLQLKLHVDTGSDSILLSPRLRQELGLEQKPQGVPVNHGSGVNGAYAWDLAMAVAIEADGGHPKVEGKIPMVVPRSGSYSQPNRFFSGKNEALLFHDGVIGNNLLSLYVLVLDAGHKKLYERANSYVAKPGTP